MSIYEITTFLRELNILMEIFIVQDYNDQNESDLYDTYTEWESSRMWLIDLGRSESYCLN